MTEALQTANKLEKEFHRDSLYGNIMLIQVRQGDISGALTTFEKFGKDFQRNSLLSQIAVAQAKKGDTIGALKTADQVGRTKTNIRAQVLISVAGEFAKAGRTRDAATTFDEAIDATADDPDSLRAPILSQIAVWQAVTGNPAASSLTFEQALEAAGNLEGRSRTSSLRQIGVQQVKSGFLEWALQIADQIPEGHDRDILLSSIARAQAKKDIASSLVTGEQIQNESVKDGHLSVIAEKQAAAGDFQAAFETMEKIREDYWKSRTWRNLALLQFREAEDPASAKTSISKAVLAARNVEDESIRINLLASVAATQAKIGDQVGALQTVNSIEIDGYRGQSLSGIARTQAQAGGWEAALAWASQEGSPRVRAMALLGVAQGMLDQIDAEKQRRENP